LNAAGNIETVIGDAYEPLQGRMFDRILANPPFFLTPSSGVLYCENPLDLDGFCRKVVREGAEHLNEGGFLQMVFEWVNVKGQTWHERLSEWVDGTGCDAWVLRTYAGPPASYAHQRISNEFATSPERATAKFERTMEYYRQHEVEQIYGGVLALRRRTGANWVRFEEGRVDGGSAFGDLVQDIFETQDVLVTRTADEELLDLRPILSPHARLHQQFCPEKQLWAIESINLIIDTGLPASIPVDSSVAGFLARCDGTRSLHELTSELAQSVKVDPAQVRTQCCAVVRKLAERRFIKFASATVSKSTG
jgi:hypothetical protein